MQCPKCGKEIPNDSIFCEACGARMKKSRKALWIILSVVLAVVIAVVAFAIIQEQQECQAVSAWEKEQAAQKQQELEQQLEAEHQAKLEAERKAELARQEAARKAEAERKAELTRKGYIDLGLPSGTLWKNTNEGGEYALYTYDEAVKNFGSKIATKAQWEELKDYCTWSWTGDGYKVIGPNDNSITLPAAGYRYCDGDVDDVGTDGSYWSSTSDDSDYAWGLYFYSSEVGMDNYNRCYGQSVRLVK